MNGGVRRGGCEIIDVCTVYVNNGQADKHLQTKRSNQDPSNKKHGRKKHSTVYQQRCSFLSKMRVSAVAAIVTALLNLLGGAKEVTALLLQGPHPWCHLPFFTNGILSLRAAASSNNINTEEQERLLLTEPAMAAYVEAEVRVWLTEDVVATRNNESENEVSVAAVSFATRDAYMEATRQDILSHHGALILFVQSELRNDIIMKHLQRLGTNPYSVAKRCVDVLHHRLYRGTYTKTLTPKGAGEIAARKAVGLPPRHTSEEEDDNCLVEPPPIP